MRGEHQGVPRRHIAKLLYKNCTLAPQVLDDIGVVYDLMAHINGRTKLRQRPFNDFYCPVDASAKTAGLCKQDFLFHICAYS